MLSNEFKSIHIDLENNIYKINGQDMDEGIFYLKIEFDGEGWVVEQSSDKFYSGQVKDPKTSIYQRIKARKKQK